MKKSNKRWAVLVLVIGSFMAISASNAAAATADMAGQWKFHTNVAGIERDRDCTITQDKNEFNGSCKSEGETVSVAGTVDGDKIKFQYKVDFSGQELDITCTGTLKDATVSGSMDVQPISLTGEFTLTRAK